jgi:hypothetical protein
MNSSNKKIFLQAITFCTLFLAVSGCRKDVTPVLPEYSPKVVIEGSIETGMPSIVLLSWSVPYFGEFDYSRPEASFIKGATVVVSDGITKDTLTELNPAQGYFYYGRRISGKQGHTYTLSVSVEGKTFETTTYIGSPVGTDSLFFKGEQDSLGYIWQTFSEPAGSGDCYRWFAKRLGKDQLYAAPFNSVFDDKFIDGKTFDFAYDRGPQPNQVQQYRSDPERGYFKRGDTVVVKLCRIGRREYEFWFTYYQNKSSNSNPFSAPSNIKSMFTDYENAFGAFVGYAPAFDTIIIPGK